jgi:hypothetical protein
MCRPLRAGSRGTLIYRIEINSRMLATKHHGTVFLSYHCLITIPVTMICIVIADCMLFYFIAKAASATAHDSHAKAY